MGELEGKQPVRREGPAGLSGPQRGPAEGGRPPAGARPLRWVSALLAGALLFVPGAAYVAGAREEPIENRVQADPPSLGWRTFDDLGRFVGDRLPLRHRAVRTDAWIDEHVFAEDPAFGGSSSPRVLRGNDGFLFLADAVDAACAPHAPPERTAANLHRFASIVASSGREMVTMVAPDKSTVHRELLPRGMAKKNCFSAYIDRLWSSLASADIPGYVDLRKALSRRARESREPLYLRKDSHWDSAGSLVAVEAAVERIRPGLWRPSEVRFDGLYKYRGDLTGLLGQVEEDEAPRYGVERPDVQRLPRTKAGSIERAAIGRFRNRAPSGRLLQGRTLLLLDSFGLVAVNQIAPFFEDLTTVNLADFDAARFTHLIEDAERVWFLSVERGLSYRLKEEIGSPRFLDRLAGVLLASEGER